MLIVATKTILIVQIKTNRYCNYRTWSSDSVTEGLLNKSNVSRVGQEQSDFYRSEMSPRL